MENKIPHTDMRGLIKNTKGTFFTALALFLIPLLIINLYLFYSAYDGFTIDFAAVEQFDFTRILNGDTEAFYEAQELLPTLFKQDTSDLTVTDSFFEIFGFALCVISDTFFILLGLASLNNEKIDSGRLLGFSVKRCFTTVICCLLSSLVISEAQSAVTGSVFSVMMSTHISLPAFAPASFVMLVLSILLSAFIVSWLMLFIYYMNVAGVSGRARTFFTLGYARELLRGKIMKNTFKIMPFVTLSIILPIVLNSLAILNAEYMTASLILTAISIILQFTFNALTWMYIIPDFFVFEQECGIQNKIREMIEKIKNQQNNDKEN